MNRLNTGHVIISVAAILLMGTLIFVFLGQNKTEPTLSTDPVFQEKALEIVGLEVGQKNAIGREIYAIHTELNLAVGYGATPTKDNATSLRTKANMLKALMEENITYEPLAEDLDELIYLLTNSVADDRNSGWIKAHRIAHDLDYFLFNPRQKPGVPFGVSKTLPALADEAASGH